MCDGKIVAPNSVSSVSIKGFRRRNVLKLLINYIRNVIDSNASCNIIANQFKINMCPRCGDLCVGGRWLEIPHPQRQMIGDEIKYGTIYIKDRVSTVCQSCLNIEEKIEKTQYSFSCLSFLDAYSAITQTSSGSF